MTAITLPEPWRIVHWNNVIERAKLVHEKSNYKKNYERYYLHHTGLHNCRAYLCIPGKKNEGWVHTLTAGLRHARYGSHIILYTDNIFLTRINRNNSPCTEFYFTSRPLWKLMASPTEQSGPSKTIRKSLRSLTSAIFPTGLLLRSWKLLMTLRLQYGTCM